VPRIRTDVARDEKVDEIVKAARQRLLDGGYPALSIIGLSRELGLAQNAIYWYFPTKDHLFVAAMERILHDILDRLPPRQGPCIERVLWFVERLSEFQALRITMRERAQCSEVVAAFERDVVAWLRVLLVGVISHQVPAEDLDPTVDAVMALCEGVLLREFDEAQRSRLIRFGFERLVPAGG
jgi:AcrR family transcriptional regulator